MAAAPAVIGIALELVFIRIQRRYPASVLQIIPHRTCGLGIRTLHQHVNEPGLLSVHVLILALLIQPRIQLFDNLVHPVKGVEVRAFHTLQVGFLIPGKLHFQNSLFPLGCRPGHELSGVHAEDLVVVAAPLLHIVPEIHIVHKIQRGLRGGRQTDPQGVLQKGGLGIIDECRTSQEPQHITVHRQNSARHLQNTVIHVIPVYGVFNLVQLQARHLPIVQFPYAARQALSIFL